MDVAVTVNTIIMARQALAQIINDKIYLFSFLVLWVILFGMVFYIPVKTVPGNDVSFQSKIFTYKDYLFLTAISFLSSSTIIMQIKIFKQRASAKIVAGNSVLGGVGILSGITSSIFGTATCSLCVGAIFSFLGANAIFFLIDNRIIVVAISFVLLILSAYFSAKKLNDNCDSCHL